MGPSSLSSEPPGQAVRSHQAVDLAAELPLEHRPPRHEREFARLLDESEPAAGQIDAPQREFCFLRIEDRRTYDHIGEIGYTVTEVTPAGKLVGVGYFLREACWGRGYAAEALGEVLRYAFEQDNVCRVSCGCLKENAASERVMQKCGMIKEAERREFQWHEGRLKDRVEYRLLRSEWLSSDFF